MSFKRAEIKNFWIGLPSGTNKIDAVYERKSDSRIIFFIGERPNPLFWFVLILVRGGVGAEGLNIVDFSHAFS